MISEVTHINRHGHPMKVIRISDTEFEIRYIDTSFMRISRIDENTIEMIDPAGGPYITAEIKSSKIPGLNMSYFHKDWDFLVVEKIDLFLPENKVSLKCKYAKPIEWITIQKEI